jgi:hypothetical protein
LIAGVTSLTHDFQEAAQHCTTTRSQTVAGRVNEEDAMVTLLLAAAVASYVLIAAYVLSWPPTTPV